MSYQELIDQIIAQGMLPLFYYDDLDTCIETIRTLYENGITVIEYTNRGPFALNNFKELIKLKENDLPNLTLGIGTIKSADEAKNFIQANADFIVAPITNPEVAMIAKKHNTPWIPGCMTPTEIFEAQELQAKLIKIFPAEILGPQFVSSIKSLFQGQLFMPTGGVSINEDNLKAWFHSGVCAVGMGSKLINEELLQSKNYIEIGKRAKIAKELIEKVRS